MEKSYYEAPIGVLEIGYENCELISLKLVKNAGISAEENDFIINVKSQLNEYFKGKRKAFDIKIKPNGTEFQKLVWAELYKIEYGKTKRYSDVAENIGKKDAQRAVGTACGKNPIMLIIPCHRVVAKNGSIGGFAYGAGVKQTLLDLETHFYKPD